MNKAIILKSEHIIYAVFLVWFGALLGVSFIATPAKFLVLELDLITAIKIGRETFGVFHCFEYVLMTMVIVLLFVLKPSRGTWVYCLLLAMLLACQKFGILPMLESNSNKLFSGQTSTATKPHVWFVITEFIKALLLIGYLPIALWANKD